MDDYFILTDGMGDIDIIDTRGMASGNICTLNKQEKLPTRITGSYDEDYNILYVDDIIRKTLIAEKHNKLPILQRQLAQQHLNLSQPQKTVARKLTLSTIQSLQSQIAEIENGSRLQFYINSVDTLLDNYRHFKGNVRVIVFDEDESSPVKEPDNIVIQRLSIIDQYFSIASKYIEINVVRNKQYHEDICNGCHEPLSNVAINEDGTQRCPNCDTEHDVIIMVKLPKDGIRINTSVSSEDESIESFKKAFTRYQGLQTDVPDKSIYEELDNYFRSNDCPTSDEVRRRPLNDRGRREGTNHKMLWDALSKIGRSKYYEDANYIGHHYWGWILPNVEHLRERILDKYYKTQKEYYKIPREERDRTSSLGTQYRLWRLLQLENHECYIDEFRIAENPDSIRIHDRLWKIMCDNCPDEDIYYINNDN